MRRIYNINDEDFDPVALEVFRFQYEHNPLYRRYCQLLSCSAAEVKEIRQIPFLPISFFKTHEVMTGDWRPEKTFRSSGTSGMIQSLHHVRELDWYHQIAGVCFSRTFASTAMYTWIGLLPTYLERPDSSLIDMVSHFMKQGDSMRSKFYPSVESGVLEALDALAAHHAPVILIGVSFALLDLLEQYKIPVWDQLQVIETGGMKGRREEITRAELHARMRSNHPRLNISSEYGMTELMSQAYMTASSFTCGPTMKVLVREISDPIQYLPAGQRGVINVIDLGNMDSCAFVATEDVGVLQVDGSFDVLGRLDQSDIRGCNLLYA